MCRLAHPGPCFLSVCLLVPVVRGYSGHKPGRDFIGDIVLGDIGYCGMPEGSPSVDALQRGSNQQEGRHHVGCWVCWMFLGNGRLWSL